METYDTHIKICKDDVKKIVEYYHNFQIDENNFEPPYVDLIKITHKFAYIISIFINEIQNDENHALPYLIQIKSDSINMINSIAMGNMRNNEIYKRSIIENLLRYIFYYHHEIEHIKSQINESHITISDLFLYLNTHPIYKTKNKKNNIQIKNEMKNLRYQYSKISKRIHNSNIKQMNFIDNIQSITKEQYNIHDEIDEINRLFKSVLFILFLFENEKYIKIKFVKKSILTSTLTSEQKRIVHKII